MNILRAITLLVLSIPISIPGFAADYKIEVVAEGLNFPWSIAFLPNGDYLVAMRAGEIRQISADGDISPAFKGTPAAYVAGQGGYFDIVLDPNFDTNQSVYLSYAGGSPAANATTVLKATLRESSFADSTIIFAVEPTKNTPLHYGGKLLFLPDGTLMVTTGDGFDFREAAQDKKSQIGKAIRIHSDGSVPADNPFVGNDSGNDKIYSYGHRNPQGLAQDPLTGNIYLHEHGPKGGDELNLLAPGNNYGWPAVTYGDNYSGAYVSPLQQYPGITDPVHYWVPSIAPSGMAVYRGDVFPEWQGDIFVGALVDQEVRRLEMDNGKVVSETPLFAELEARIRDVRVGPDGNLYLITDGNPGKIIRVTR
ncbi:MAG: glucose/arabinose dehydrogenase [Candidatus Azotimanducaceae bacterium]|jgi:glucose/arabinose dehydrogenase